MAIAPCHRPSKHDIGKCDRMTWPYIHSQKRKQHHPNAPTQLALWCVRTKLNWDGVVPSRIVGLCVFSLRPSSRSHQCVTRCGPFENRDFFPFLGDAQRSIRCFFPTWSASFVRFFLVNFQAAFFVRFKMSCKHYIYIPTAHNTQLNIEQNQGNGILYLCCLFSREEITE